MLVGLLERSRCTNSTPTISNLELRQPSKLALDAADNPLSGYHHRLHTMKDILLKHRYTHRTIHCQMRFKFRITCTLHLTYNPSTPNYLHHLPLPHQHIQRVLAMVTVWNLRSLRSLAVRLARECSFGDNLMANASTRGKGGPGKALVQLDHVRMTQNRGITRNCSEWEFEAIWAKSLPSISEAGQNLRYSRLSKKSSRPN